MTTEAGQSLEFRRGEEPDASGEAQGIVGRVESLGFIWSIRASHCWV